MGKGKCEPHGNRQKIDRSTVGGTIPTIGSRDKGENRCRALSIPQKSLRPEAVTGRSAATTACSILSWPCPERSEVKATRPTPSSSSPGTGGGRDGTVRLGESII